MKNTKVSLLVTLFACMGNGNSHYTKAHVDVIIDLLAKIHETKVKRRWIFECLRYLEDNGLIKRKKRYKRQDDGTILQTSSMISFTFKGVKELYKLGVRGARQLLDTMLKWWQKKDGRFPEPEPELRSIEPMSNTEVNRMAKNFLAGLA